MVLALRVWLGINSAASRQESGLQRPRLWVKAHPGEIKGKRDLRQIALPLRSQWSAEPFSATVLVVNTQAAALGYTCSRREMNPAPSIKAVPNRASVAGSGTSELDVNKISADPPGPWLSKTIVSLVEPSGSRI